MSKLKLNSSSNYIVPFDSSVKNDEKFEIQGLEDGRKQEGKVYKEFCKKVLEVPKQLRMQQV